MTSSRIQTFIGLLSFLWVGMVSSISFLEAWLKFTAPGVTLSVGLSIGKVVFSALNTVELILCSIIIILIMTSDFKKAGIQKHLSLLTVVAILLLQTFWVLPILSGRIDIYQSGHIPEPSNLHMVFVIMEVLKVTFLIIYAFNQTKLWKTSSN